MCLLDAAVFGTEGGTESRARHLRALCPKDTRVFPGHARGGGGGGVMELRLVNVVGVIKRTVSSLASRLCVRAGGGRASHAPLTPVCKSQSLASNTHAPRGPIRPCQMHVPSAVTPRDGGLPVPLRISQCGHCTPGPPPASCGGHVSPADPTAPPQSNEAETKSPSCPPELPVVAGRRDRKPAWKCPPPWPWRRARLTGHGGVLCSVLSSKILPLKPERHSAVVLSEEHTQSVLPRSP